MFGPLNRIVARKKIQKEIKEYDERYNALKLLTRSIMAVAEEQPQSAEAYESLVDKVSKELIHCEIERDTRRFELETM